MLFVQTWWHWFSLACDFFFISIILKIYWQSKSALAINTGHELPHKNNNVLTELQYMRACLQPAANTHWDLLHLKLVIARYFLNFFIELVWLNTIHRSLHKKTNNCSHFFLPLTNNCSHYFAITKTITKIAGKGRILWF